MSSYRRVAVSTMDGKLVSVSPDVQINFQAIFSAFFGRLPLDKLRSVSTSYRNCFQMSYISEKGDFCSRIS